MLTEDGVRIVDFGLATFADALKLTAEHSTLGTAAYMSPEQVRGLTADARSECGRWASSSTKCSRAACRSRVRTPRRSRMPSERDASADSRIASGDGRGDRASRLPRDAQGAAGSDLRTAASYRARCARCEAIRSSRFPHRAGSSPEAQAATGGARQRTSRRKVLAAVAAAVLAIGVAAVWLLWPVERLSIAVAPFGNQTGDSDLERYRLALTQTLTLSLGDSRPAGDALRQGARGMRRFLQQKADVSSRDAIQAITAATGAELVVVPTLLRDGGAWRARVELRDPRTSNSVWEHDTTPEVSSLTRDVAYRSAMSLAEDLQAHLKSRRTSVIDMLRSVWPWSRDDHARRWQSIDIAKAFAEGTA